MALEIHNLTIGYKGSPVLAGDISLTVPEGELIALMGRNGVGKSTMLRSLAGISRPLEGDIQLDGVSLFSMDLKKLSRHIAFVSTEIVSVAHLRVWDIAALGRAPYTGWIGILDGDDKAKITSALEQVGMLGFADIALDRLSDGERQRVMIARALAQDTKMILLDEPTAYLDLPNRYQIIMLLRNLAHSTGKIIIFSTHDLSAAARLCDTVWVMSGAGVVAGASEDLAGNGGFEPIFRDTALSFDRDTAEVRLELRPLAYVRVGFGSPLLMRVLERCCIGIDDSSEHVVSALFGGGYEADGQFCHTIYELSRYLNSLHE